MFSWQLVKFPDIERVMHWNCVPQISALWLWLWHNISTKKKTQKFTSNVYLEFNDASPELIPYHANILIRPLWRKAVYNMIELLHGFLVSFSHINDPWSIELVPTGRWCGTWQDINWSSWPVISSRCIAGDDVDKCLTSCYRHEIISSANQDKQGCFHWKQS